MRPSHSTHVILPKLFSGAVFRPRRKAAGPFPGSGRCIVQARRLRVVGGYRPVFVEAFRAAKGGSFRW